jgi:hypothetical protein
MSRSCWSSFFCFSLVSCNLGDQLGRGFWFYGRRHLDGESYDDGFDAHWLACFSLLCAYLAGLSSLFVKLFHNFWSENSESSNKLISCLLLLLFVFVF